MHQALGNINCQGPAGPSPQVCSEWQRLSSFCHSASFRMKVEQTERETDRLLFAATKRATAAALPPALQSQRQHVAVASSLVRGKGEGGASWNGTRVTFGWAQTLKAPPPPL